MSRWAFFFIAILNSYKKTAVLNICGDTDPIVARKVARKRVNLCLNSLCHVLLIRLRKQCFSLSNVLICVKGHLTAALSVIDLARIIYLRFLWKAFYILYLGKQNVSEFCYKFALTYLKLIMLYRVSGCENCNITLK